MILLKIFEKDMCPVNTSAVRNNEPRSRVLAFENRVPRSHNIDDVVLFVICGHDDIKNIQDLLLRKILLLADDVAGTLLGLEIDLADVFADYAEADHLDA